MKSIFEQNTYNEIKKRLDNLSEDAQPQWGKMNVGQMVHHCQAPLNIILEKKDYGLKPNWFVKTFFKKSLYNDKPWKKGLPTAPAFKETEPRNFDEEKKTLENLMDQLVEQKDRDDWPIHPMFGVFTKDQWGQMQYKHLDHHLRQFGV